MHITIFHKGRHGVRHLHFSRAQAWLCGFALLLALPVGTAALAWKLAKHQFKQEGQQEATSTWLAEVEGQRRALTEAKANAQHQLDALTAKLGTIQARAIRLDALGERLTRIAGLDAREFNFDDAPGVGGPASELKSKLEVYDFINELDRLSVDLSERGDQMNALESVLLSRTLSDEQTISGRPVRSGWIASYFGVRTDPFEGGSAWHEGIDFSGSDGADVMTTAGGIVIFSGKMSGYGNLVEVSHGDGFTTRYGHNEENLVKVGDIVRKGQVVAKMGSTGRSTGTHVHYEVLKNNQPQNPMKFINRG